MIMSPLLVEAHHFFWRGVRGDRRIRDKRQNADRGEQRQVITSTFIQATPSPFVSLCFIISQTRSEARDVLKTHRLVDFHEI